MKVLVIGANGMLGHDVMDACRAAGHDTLGFDLPELDVTNYADMRSLLPEAEWVINCSAYTRVDDAEAERSNALAVNFEGVRNLARIGCNRLVPIIHISTDYVFDGRTDKPYREKDPPSPINIYGTSKLAGEKALRSAGGPFLIVRTQSLFGRHGHHFVRAIAQKIRASDEPLRVVDDQITAPTYTRHLAGALVRLMKAEPEGIVHVTASGACSWYEFACTIVQRLKPGHQVIPVKSTEMERPAERPKYTVLDNRRYREVTGHQMPAWQEGLEQYLKEEKLIYSPQ